MTPDLGRDLSQELVGLLHHSRPYVRKRAVLALYKASLKHPDLLITAWPKVKELLDDPDPGLAPHMFALLTSSANNWMLIKFRALPPLEPRLAKKLMPPITNIIRTTPAMSLLYECVLTVISSGMLNVRGGGDELARMCVDKLRRFLEDADQNLKYIGLLALGKILDIHPDLIAEHRDIVLHCVDDPDYSIRARALDLVSGMVTRRNLPEVIKHLTNHLRPVPPSPSPTAVESLLLVKGDTALPRSRHDQHEVPSSTFLEAAFRADIIRCVICACSADGYAFVSSFDWYLAVLVELARAASQNPSPELGPLISGQLMDVAVRVKSARSTAVKLMVGCLAKMLVCVGFVLSARRDLNSNSAVKCLRLNATNSPFQTQVLADASLFEATVKCASIPPILEAAAWICGEYCGLLSDPTQVITYLMKPEVLDLPGSVQQVFVHNALKIFIHWLGTLGYAYQDLVEEVTHVGRFLSEGLVPFTVSEHIEVQERACSAAVVTRLVLANLQPPSELGCAIPSTAALTARFTSFRPLFFSAELNPVAPRAQSKVPVPDGLDLSVWIHPEAADAGHAPAHVPEAFGFVSTNAGWGDIMFEGGGIDVGAGGRRGETEQVLLFLVWPLPEERRNCLFFQRLNYELIQVPYPIQQRKLRMRNGPFYLPCGETGRDVGDQGYSSVDDIPIVQLTLDSPDNRFGWSPIQQRRTSSPSPPPVEIDRTYEMPENAVFSNEEPDGPPAAGTAGKKDTKCQPHCAEERGIPETASAAAPSALPDPPSLSFRLDQPPDRTLQLQDIAHEPRDARGWPEVCTLRADAPFRRSFRLLAAVIASHAPASLCRPFSPEFDAAAGCPDSLRGGEEKEEEEE
ncbi:MAG: armadillo-type protein [Olpidium bornovanus]|uniref:Armadillo-type protein n=1 Tax=Olpidium bornovanus TaxID=278681 RepID=A0A8H8A113_9FUNG|nr:MAG: armadillo-type protein [Olpidium bornovanus]